jgi:drug/metabolite transporter (DMT)-like permease
MSTLVCSGAAVTLTAAALLASDLQPGAVTPAGFGWLAAIAILSTVGAITLFFAGLRRVGPTPAAVLSTVEPVVTIGLAVPVFGESLTAVQLAGAGLVLAAVLAVRAPVSVPVPRREPVPEAG